MTGMTDHGFGCACRSHVDRPWNRSEHWTQAEVDFLTSWRGRRPDAWIAEQLGRSEVGVFLKARRLGIGKKDAGWTARETAIVFGVDPTTITKHWIPDGLLVAYPGGGLYRGAKRGPHWYVPADELPRLATRGHLGKADPSRIRQLYARHEQRLEERRNRRKGVAA